MTRLHPSHEDSGAITHWQLVKQFTYSAETGEMRRKSDGKILPLCPTIDWKTYSLPQLVWLYVYGVWSSGSVHLKDPALGCRIENLVSWPKHGRPAVTKTPPLSEYKKRLSYNPETGLFTWLDYAGDDAKRRKRIAGKTAQTIRYMRNSREPSARVLRYGGATINQARLAWGFIHGEIPDIVPFHLNHNVLDNRPENLSVLAPEQLK